MGKKGFGKFFYFASLIASLVMMIIIFIIGRKAANADQDIKKNFYQLMYILIVITFNLILPLGILVREFMNGLFVKNKLILKSIIVLLLLILNLFLNILIGTVDIGRITMYCSVFALIYSLVPTLKNETKV